MSREYPSSTPTSAVAEPAAALKQPLHRALASLSVDLDAELIRYRQSRQGEVLASTPKGLTFRKRRKPIDLIRVAGRSEVKPVPPQPASMSGAPVPPPPPPPNPRLLQASHQSNYPLDTVALVPAEPPLPNEGGALISYTHVPDDYLESTEALLNASNPARESDYAPQDTDYEPSLLKSLTTPLGLGALLLLLVSSAGFGYLLTNPQALGHIWNLPALQALQGQPSNPDETGPGGGDFEPGLQGLGPDLSQKEFVDLNLARLSTLPPEETGAPTIASTPTSLTLPPVAVQPGTATVSPSAPTPAGAKPPTPTPAQPRTVVSPPTTVSQIPITVAPRVQRAPAPTRPAPAPARPPAPEPAAAPAPPRPPAPVQTAPAPLPAPAEPAAAQPASSNYYVVTDFTGDQSLSTARSAVGEAYVRNFPEGARIQMGSFADPSSAETLVQDLQQQGIPAEVYTP